MEAEALEDVGDEPPSFDDTSGAERHRPFPRPFGRYVLLQSLAEGGMGEVFFAKTRMLDDGLGGSELSVAEIEKSCIVKTLRGHLTSDREYVARFIDEARLVVQLNHRNICHVFDVGRVGTRYYLAMEFIPGRDARTLASRAEAMGRRLPEAMALFIVSEMLEALDYAHRRVHPVTGAPLLLVHRDVSPQNVMVSFEGEVKLIDFGLAASTMKREHTKPEVVMGKLAYMSPEQARGEEVDATTDQYAAAILAYELVTGERFYGDMPQHEVWFAAGRGGHVPPHWAKLHPTVAKILQKALHQQPWSRYASCGDMKEDIQRALVERKLRATARDLRLFMEDVFKEDIAGQQRLLESMSNTPAPPAPAASPEQSVSIASARQTKDGLSEPTLLEKSESIASAPTVVSTAIPPPSSSDALPVGEKTETGIALPSPDVSASKRAGAPAPGPGKPVASPPERTQLVRRGSGTKEQDAPIVSVISVDTAAPLPVPKPAGMGRRIAIAAVVVVVLAAATTAVFVDKRGDVVATAKPPPPAAVAAVPIEPIAPTPVPTPKPAVAVAVVEPPAPPPPVATPTTAPTPVAAKPPKPRDEPRRPPKAPRKALPPAPLAVGENWQTKRAWLTAHCKDVGCTAKAVTPPPNLLSGGANVATDWMNRMDGCIRKCVAENK